MLPRVLTERGVQAGDRRRGRGRSAVGPLHQHAQQDAAGRGRVELGLVERKARRSVLPAARVLLIVVPANCAGAAQVALDVGGRQVVPGVYQHAVAVAAHGGDQQVRDRTAS